MYENNANGSKKKRKREEKEKKKNERSGEKGLNKRVPFIRQRNFEVVCSRRVPCRRGWDARGPGRGKMNSTKGEKVTGKGPARDVLSGLVVRPSPPSGAAPASIPPLLPVFVLVILSHGREIGTPRKLPSVHAPSRATNGL